MQSLLHPGQSMVVEDPTQRNPYATHQHNEKVDVEYRESILAQLGVDVNKYAEQFRAVFDGFAKRMFKSSVTIRPLPIQAMVEEFKERATDISSGNIGRGERRKEMIIVELDGTLTKPLKKPRRAIRKAKKSPLPAKRKKK